MSRAPAPVRRSWLDLWFTPIVVLATALVWAGLGAVFFVAPVERTMGIVQKIFYFHVPSAVCMYCGAAACFVGSVAYLERPTDLRDCIGRVGAELAVLYGVIVLGTGSLWASKAWGTFWTWDPRLTTVLLSFLIYVAYLVLRSFAGGGDAERKFAAALGIVGAGNLPIIHFSVQKWAGQHPTVITGRGGGLAHQDMQLALSAGFAAMLSVAVVFFLLRVRGQLLEVRLRHLEEDALDRGIGDTPSP